MCNSGYCHRFKLVATKFFKCMQCAEKSVGSEPMWGWGGTPLYGLYRSVRPEGYGFSAVLVINRVSILADFGHFGHK